MIRRPPRSTRTDTLFPYTTLFRSEEQRDHVEQQVAQVGMDETVRDQPVVLLVAVDRRWPQDPAVEQLPVVECQPRNDAGGDDDDECDRQVHRTVLPPRSEERRVGEECVSTGRSGCSPYH